MPAFSDLLSTEYAIRKPDRIKITTPNSWIKKRFHNFAGDKKYCRMKINKLLWPSCADMPRIKSRRIEEDLASFIKTCFPK